MWIDFDEKANQIDLPVLGDQWVVRTIFIDGGNYRWINLQLAKGNIRIDAQIDLLSVVLSEANEGYLL